MLNTAHHQRNANQNHNEIIPHVEKWHDQDDHKYMSARTWRKRTLYTTGGDGSWCGHYGKQYRGSSGNQQYSDTGYSNSTPEHTGKENENVHLKLYRHPNAHSSIVYDSQDVEAT